MVWRLMCLQLTFALLLSLLMLLVTGSPDHDERQAKVDPITAPQTYDTDDYDRDEYRRRLNTAPVGTQTCTQIHSSASWGPLRIGYELVNVGSVSTALQNLVKDQLMQRAAAYWGAALRVRQAAEPLRMPRKCDSTLGNYCVQPSSSARTCDHVPVPSAYLASQTTCTQSCIPPAQCIGNCIVGGQCNCDLTQWQQQKSSYCCTMIPGNTCPSGCDVNSAVWSPSISHPYCVGGCTTTAAGPGAVNEDIHVFVTIEDSGSCPPPGSTSGALASAVWCAKDQCDRPTFGTINFCKSRLSLDAADLNSQISIAVHEMGHTLGFSSGLFKYFRHADGSPLFARSASHQDSFINGIKWSCSSTSAGSSISFPDSNGGYLWVDIAPSSGQKVVDVFSERDITGCNCPLGQSTMGSTCLPGNVNGFSTPHCVIKFVMPKVLKEVRDFFNCQSLNGAEIENKPTSLCTIMGSHWEQRVFNGEVMSSITDAYVPQYLSRMTLALFEDSGWYSPVYSMADTLVHGVHWGYMQGCGFATGKCISGGVASSSMFCAGTASGSQPRRCSLDRTRVLECRSATYANSPPIQFDYGTGTQLGHGGVAWQMDYCSSYSQAFTNLICTGFTSAPASAYNFHREIIGTNSRCFDSTLYGQISGQQLQGGAPQTPVQLCYEVDCAADKQSYTVKAAQGQASTPTQLLGTCTQGGTSLAPSSTSGLSGTVTCAPPAEICVSPAIHLQGAAGAPTTTTKTSTTTKQPSTTTTKQTSTTTKQTPTGTHTTTTTTKKTSTSTTKTSTTKTVTTITTTVTPAGVVSATLDMQVSDTTSFLADTAAQSAVEHGIADAISVNPTWVTATFNIVRRLLDSEEDDEVQLHWVPEGGRRLANGTLRVSYTVTVPPSGNVNTVATAVNSASVSSLTSTISARVQAAVPSKSYGVIVQSKTATNVNNVPFTTNLFTTQTTTTEFGPIQTSDAWERRCSLLVLELICFVSMTWQKDGQWRLL